MGLKPVKYVTIDDQTGALYSAGKQSLLIPVTFIQAIDFTFSQLVGREGADILIYKIGEALGREYVFTLESILKERKTKLSPEMKVRINCNAIFMEAGWGRVEILNIDLSRKLLKLKISYSPSREFLKESKYSLEKGIIAGLYKGVTQEEVYCQLIKENKKEHFVVLEILKEVPRKIREREKLVLLTRKELEKKIKETTKELQERVKGLEIFHRLTVGRELKMIELKEEITKLKEQLQDQKHDSK